MQIKWLRKALLNLDKEAEFIAIEDPHAAQLIMQRIRHTVSLLKDNPSMGYPGRLPDTRELVIPKTSYLVPYRVKPRQNRIEILRVFHTSRQKPEKW